MNIRFPSYTKSNPLTWKCKFFGCKNEVLPLTWYEDSEKHGIKNISYCTVITITKRFSFKGCLWCHNYDKILEEEIEGFPVWECYCEKCNKDEIK
jgi:hypothetical protein